MKIKQLDYTSIMNANSAQLNAKSLNTATLSGKMSQSNLKKIDSIYAHQKQAMKYQGAADVVNSVLQFAGDVTSVAQTYQKAKAAEEQAEATRKYGETVGQWEAEVNELIQTDKLYKPGSMEYSDEYNALTEKYDQAFKDLGFSKATTKNMVDNFASYQSSQGISHVRSYISSLNADTQKWRQEDLNQAIEDAIRAGGADMSGIEALVNSWGDIPNKDRVIAAAKKAVETGAIANEAKLTTDTSGYNDGLGVLKKAYDEGKLTLDEYDTYNSQIAKRHAFNLQQNNQLVADSYAEVIQNGGSVMDARAAAMEIISNAPEEDREALTQTLNTSQLSTFYKDNPWINEVAYMSNEEIAEKISLVEEDAEGYFKGVEGEASSGLEQSKETLIKGMRDQINSNVQAQYKDQLNNLNNQLGYFESLFDAGAINGSQFVSMASSLISNSPQLAGSAEAMEAVQKSVNKIIDGSAMSTFYKEKFKDKIAAVAAAASTLKMDGFDADEFMEDVQKKVMDFIYDYGKNEGAEAQVDAFLDSLDQDNLKSLLKGLSKDSEIKWGGGFLDDTVKMDKYFSLLDYIDGGELFYVDKSDIDYDSGLGVTTGGESNMGEVRFVGLKAREAWNNACLEGAWTINQIYGKGTASALNTTYAEVSGSFVPAFNTSEGYLAIVPTYGTDGKVKGANVMKAVIEQDENGRSMITDWKIAHAVTSKGEAIPFENGSPVLHENGEETASINLATGKPNLPTGISPAEVERASTFDFSGVETPEDTATLENIKPVSSSIARQLEVKHGITDKDKVAEASEKARGYLGSFMTDKKAVQYAADWAAGESVPDVDQEDMERKEWFSTRLSNEFKVRFFYDATEDEINEALDLVKQYRINGLSDKDAVVNAVTLIYSRK